MDFWSTSQNSWGLISGFQYGSERKFTSGTINNIPVNAANDTSKYRTHFLYFGTLYRWESFYLPLAFTYGMTQFTTADPTESGEAKNGVGALLGIGWFIGDHFVIEYIGRSASTELEVSSSGNTMNLTGFISTSVLNLKYFF